MKLTKEIVASKWREIVINRLPADKGSNDWVWRLVQWATAEKDAEIARLRAEIETVQQVSTGALEGVMTENAELRAAIKALHTRLDIK